MRQVCASHNVRTSYGFCNHAECYAKEILRIVYCNSHMTHESFIYDSFVYYTLIRDMIHSFRVLCQKEFALCIIY